MSEIVRVKLPNGEVVWAHVIGSPEVDGGEHGAEDVGLLDRPKAVEGFVETVRGVAESVRQAALSARPGSVTVQFGLSLSAKSGKVISVLAEAGAASSLTVTLSWEWPVAAERADAAVRDAGIAEAAGA
ncbi:MAG: CU044_2847 family protein [Pseudonocardiaceae bacterium]